MITVLLTHNCLRCLYIDIYHHEDKLFTDGTASFVSGTLSCSHWDVCKLRDDSPLIVPSDYANTNED